MENGVNVVNKRLEIYEFLSYSYLNTPSMELLEQIKLNSQLLEELTGISFEDKDRSLEDYEQEYYNRFFVPTSKLFVPPFEAAIRNRSKKEGKLRFGKMDSKETFHVKACYEMVDFKTVDLNSFRPIKDITYADHIAFELSFMTYLITMEKRETENRNEENASKWRKLQKDFRTEHLSNWIDDYAQLTKEKGDGLYSYLSNIAAKWIDLDMEYFFDKSEDDEVK